MVVVLSSYSTASHAKGRFFVLLSREKISSNHDTSVLIVFIFSHNMALFLLSFFLFFCRSSLLLSSLSSSETVWLQSRAATNLRGHISENRTTHASFSTIIKASGSLSLFGFSYYNLLYTLGFREFNFLLNSRA